MDRATISLHYLLHLRDYIKAHGSARISSQACCEREIGLLKSTIRNNRLCYENLFNRLLHRESAKLIDWIIPDEPKEGRKNRFQVELKNKRHVRLRSEHHRAIDEAGLTHGFAPAALKVYAKHQLDCGSLITSVPGSFTGQQIRQSSIIRLQDDDGQDRYGEAVQFLARTKESQQGYVLVDEFVDIESIDGYIRVGQQQNCTVWQVGRIQNLLGRYDIRDSTYLFHAMNFVKTIDRYDDAYDPLNRPE